jgi:hypothetical protein
VEYSTSFSGLVLSGRARGVSLTQRRVSGRDLYEQTVSTSSTDYKNDPRLNRISSRRSKAHSDTPRVGGANVTVASE